MVSIPCYLEIDGNVVTIRSRNRTTLMTIKLEAGMEGTMSRIDPTVDCDNFWMAFKPADGVVFNDRLFDTRKKLVAKELKFDIV